MSFLSNLQHRRLSRGPRGCGASSAAAQLCKRESNRMSQHRADGGSPTEFDDIQEFARRRLARLINLARRLVSGIPEPRLLHLLLDAGEQIQSNW